MEISELNPFIRHSRFHKIAFPMRIEPSICYDCRLFYFDNTPGTFFIGKEIYKITNKMVVYLPPETEYKISIDFLNNFSLIVFNFDLTHLNKHIKASLGTASKSDFDKNKVPSYTLCKEFSSPIVREFPDIEKMLIKCTDSFTLKYDYYREISSALLKLSLLEIIKSDSQIAYSDLCNKVLNYINNNFSNPELTNEDIASFFNYHPYHLSNIIKQETGKTLHQFLVYYRLRNARDLLTATNHNISYIAWKSGFQSAAHFTYAFRQNIGMTPKEYRLKSKNNFI